MSNAQSDQPYSLRELQTPVSVPPRHVVSLVPALTESLFDLQLGGCLVGITDQCIYSGERVKSLPRFGPPWQPDLQKIVALKPDLVLADILINRQEDIDALQREGISVWVTGAKSVQEGINLLWEIMSVFDEPAMLERARWIERLMDWTASVVPEARRPRVFAPLDRNPWITFTRETYPHDVLRICGGDNVFADWSGETEADDCAAADCGRRPILDRSCYPAVTSADIIATQPEIILLPATFGMFDDSTVRELQAWDTPAARTNRIIFIDDTLLTWPGTRVAHALTELPPLLSGVEGGSRV